jgi:hypothetical protein
MYTLQPNTVIGVGIWVEATGHFRKTVELARELSNSD